MNKSSTGATIGAVLLLGMMGIYYGIGATEDHTGIDSEQMIETISRLDQSVRDLENTVSRLQLTMSAQASHPISGDDSVGSVLVNGDVKVNADNESGDRRENTDMIAPTTTESVITVGQQAVYESVRDRLYSGDSTMTINGIMNSNEVRSLPKPLAEKLMSQMSVMINSGQLDKQTFLGVAPAGQ